MLEIDANTVIDDSELMFKTSRSGGPGGQNVNKLNTRVVALFDVANSPSLSAAQRELILSKLRTRVDRRGILHVTSQKHRSQEANRRAAVERLQQLLRDALAPEPIRRPTQASLAVRQRRLEQKRRRSLRKSERTKRDWTGDWRQ